MIRVGIVGATGYAGGELVRILMGHKEVEIKWYGSRSYIDKEYASVYQNMFQIVDDILDAEDDERKINHRINPHNVPIICNEISAHRVKNAECCGGEIVSVL